MKPVETFFIFLNAYSGAVQAISTIVLVGITAWYVRLTKTLANAAVVELQNQATARRARRQELKANTKFLLDALLSLPISSDANTFDSSGVSLAERKTKSWTDWKDFDFGQFITLASEVSSHAGANAVLVKTKMGALASRLNSEEGVPSRSDYTWGHPYPHQLWDETIQQARSALNQISEEAEAN